MVIDKMVILNKYIWKYSVFWWESDENTDNSLVSVSYNQLV